MTGESSVYRRLSAGLVLLILAVSLRAAGFQAALDRPQIELGDTATLTLVFEGGEPTGNPVLPTVPGLTISYRSAGRQVQIVNGQTTSSIVASYEVAASQPGTFTIPPITVQMGTRLFSSSPLTLTVTRSQTAFLTLEMPRPEYFVGEAAACHVHLYAQSGELLQLPRLQGNGLTIGTNMPHTGPVPAQTNGVNWSRITWRVPVTFVRSGDIELSATDCVLEVRSRRSPGRRDPFGIDISDFAPDLFRKRLNLSTEPIRVPVRPLPPGAPDGFSGAVGQFSLQAAVSTNIVTAGDPLTLSVRVSGQGNLDSFRFTLPEDWDRFKTYSPSSKAEYVDDLGLRGTRTFEIVIVPETAAVKEIPAFRFSFFHPEEARYRTLEHPPIPIQVRPSGITAAQPVVLAASNASSEMPARSRDIVHIKPRLGTLAQSHTLAPLRPLFLLAQFLPLALLSAVLLWCRQRDRIAADPRLRRRRQVHRLARNHLAELSTFARQGRAEEFFMVLFRLLQEQIGERLDAPAAGITRDTALPRLRALGFPASALATLEELFELCDRNRFAPDRSAADLMALQPRVQEVWDQLQRWEKPHG